MPDLKITELPDLGRLSKAGDYLATVNQDTGTTSRVPYQDVQNINAQAAKLSADGVDELLLWDIAASGFKKITKDNLLSGITGGLSYQGLWNATTNTPTLADATGTTNEYYVISVAGAQDLGSGLITFDAGDWALHNGSVWQKLENQSTTEAINIEYDNAVSGLSSTNVQEAVDELDTNIDANTTAIGLNTTHRTSDGKDHSDVVLNNTHRTGDGSDHANVSQNTTDIGTLETTKLDSVVAGDNITVDNTDPLNPVIASSGVTEEFVIAMAAAL